MIHILIKKFIPNYENTLDRNVRERYGLLAGYIGVFCNLILFVVKLAIGFVINSLSVISDAFNNLTDLFSTVIALFGVKLSNQPPDKEHPNGHGRYEYIASLVLAFLIFAVGLTLLKSAINKIIHPSSVNFNTPAIIILFLSLGVKLWMFSYNRYIGEAINSGINRANAKDSLSDVLVTTSILISIVFGFFFDFPIDGYAALIVSLFVLYSGFDIAKDTVNLLLGSTPDPELFINICNTVRQGEFIVGAHDIVLHDYGPGRIVGSIHAEVPENTQLKAIHTVIDHLEKKIEDIYGVHMVIHVDPISVNEERIKVAIDFCTRVLIRINPDCQIENVRYTEEKNGRFMNFDLVVPKDLPEENFHTLSDALKNAIECKDPRYTVTIHRFRYHNETNCHFCTRCR